MKKVIVLSAIFIAFGCTKNQAPNIESQTAELMSNHPADLPDFLQSHISDSKIIQQVINQPAKWTCLTLCANQYINCSLNCGPINQSCLDACKEVYLACIRPCDSTE